MNPYGPAQRFLVPSDLFFAIYRVPILMSDTMRRGVQVNAILVDAATLRGCALSPRDDDLRVSADYS